MARKFVGLTGQERRLIAAYAGNLRKAADTVGMTYSQAQKSWKRPDVQEAYNKAIKRQVSQLNMDVKWDRKALLERWTEQYYTCEKVDEQQTALEHIGKLLGEYKGKQIPPGMLMQFMMPSAVQVQEIRHTARLEVATELLGMLANPPSNWAASVGALAERLRL